MREETTVKSTTVVPAQVQIRKYRAKFWIRASALFFLTFSLAGLLHFWCDTLARERSLATIERLGPGLMVLVSILLVGHFFAACVTLLPEAIEVRTLWSTKRMDFDRIRGWRERVTTDSDGVKTRYIKLEPLGYQQTALEFQDFYNFDSKFYEWLYSLPELGQ